MSGLWVSGVIIVIAPEKPNCLSPSYHKDPQTLNSMVGRVGPHKRNWTLFSVLSVSLSLFFEQYFKGGLSTFICYANNRFIARAKLGLCFKVLTMNDTKRENEESPSWPAALAASPTCWKSRRVIWTQTVKSTFLNHLWRQCWRGSYLMNGAGFCFRKNDVLAWYFYT